MLQYHLFLRRPRGNQMGMYLLFDSLSWTEKWISLMDNTAIIAGFRDTLMKCHDDRYTAVQAGAPELSGRGRDR